MRRRKRKRMVMEYGKEKGEVGRGRQGPRGMKMRKEAGERGSE